MSPSELPTGSIKGLCFDTVEKMVDWFRHLLCEGIFDKGLEKSSKDLKNTRKSQVI